MAFDGIGVRTYRCPRQVGLAQPGHPPHDPTGAPGARTSSDGNAAEIGALEGDATSVLKDLVELLAPDQILGLATIVGATIVLYRWAEACQSKHAIGPKARITIERRLDEIEQRLDIVVDLWAAFGTPPPLKVERTVERRLDEIERRLDAAARELRPR